MKKHCRCCHEKIRRCAKNAYAVLTPSFRKKINNKRKINSAFKTKQFETTLRTSIPKRKD